jgi:DNA-binding transcriptional LysR family regulator
LSDINLDKINLNLVPVLRALLRESSVTGAAAALARSPSAVSETLSQLRVVLEDPLLIRVGGRLQLTPKAASLVGPLEELHKGLQAFFRNGNFDPGTSSRTFTIASSDLLIYELGGAMVQAIRQSAPNMTIHFVDVARGLTQKMSDREIDFALLPDFAVDDLAPAPIRFTGLKESSLMLLVARGHPLAGHGAVSKEELLPFRRIGFMPDAVLLEGRKKLPQGHLYIEGSGDEDAVVTVSQFLTIPHLLEGTDLIAVVPKSIADAAVRDCQVVAIELLDKFHVHRFGLAWSPVFDIDDAHRWFRKVVTKGTVQAPGPAAGNEMQRPL